MLRNNSKLNRINNITKRKRQQMMKNREKQKLFSAASNQLLPPSTNRTTTIVKNASSVNGMIKDLTEGFTPYDAQVINMLTNPYGNGHGGSKQIAVAFPDGESSKFIMVVRSVGGFSGSTATEAIIQTYPLHSGSLGVGAGAALKVLYGGDTYNSGSSPTTRQEISSIEYDIANAVLDLTAARIRHLVVGLKVQPSSNVTVTSGALRGFHTRTALTTGAATYATYGGVINNPIENMYMLPNGGMTIRSPFLPENRLFQDLPADTYSDFHGLGMFPAIRLETIGASTSVLIEAVHIVEVEVPLGLVPFAMAPVPVSSSIDRLISTANLHGYTAQGQSFKSFFNKVVKNGRGVYHFIKDHADEIEFLVKEVPKMFA